MIRGLHRDGAPPATSASAPVPSPPPVPSRATPPSEASPFSKLVASIGREVSAGEYLVDRALAGGKDLGPGELIALQAGVYRYSEAVDLAAKLVDRAQSGAKTVLQGQ